MVVISLVSTTPQDDRDMWVVAKMFDSKLVYLPKRAGERYASALTSMYSNNKVFKRFGKINLKDYVNSFIKGQKKI